MSTEPAERATPETEAKGEDAYGAKSKDFWDKIQVLGPAILGAAGVLITGMLNHHESEKREKEAAVQIMNQREQSDMGFRAKIFEVLLGRLLKNDPAEQVAVLRVFQHNFHETFNGRGFFDGLARLALADSAGIAGRQSLLRELHSIARETSAQQERIVESNVHKEFPLFRVPVGDSATVVVLLGEEDSSGERSLQFAVKVGCDLEGESDRLNREHAHRVCVFLDSVYPDTLTGGDSVRLGVRFDSAHVKGDSIEIPAARRAVAKSRRHFSVSYFDTPFTDNSLLPDGHRLAIVLKGVDSSGADLKVLEFPEDYIVSGYRPSAHLVREMLAHGSE